MAIDNNPEIKTKFSFFSPDRNKKIRALGEMRALDGISSAEIRPSHEKKNGAVAFKNIDALDPTGKKPVATFDAGGHVDFVDVHTSKRRGGLSLRGILGIASAIGIGLAAVGMSKGVEAGALALGASKVTALIAGIGSLVVGTPLLMLAGLVASALVLAMMLTWRRGRRSLRRAFL